MVFVFYCVRLVLKVLSRYFNFHKDLIKISSQVAANVNDAKKPAMYVECLAHAREWITGSVCLGSIDIVSI